LVKTVDLICNECGHKWTQEHRKRRQCPECQSYDVGPLEGGLGPDTTPADTTAKPEKPKGKPPTAAPLVQTIPKLTTSVDKEHRSSQEEEFSNLLNDVGIKQADLIASIVMRSDKAEDPKHIDDMLRKYRVPGFQRQIILDAWCSTQGLNEFHVEGGTSNVEGDEMGEMLKPMTKLMMQKVQFKMLKDMAREEEPRSAYAPPPAPPESMVPLFDDEGVPVTDANGKQAMVPASVWLIQQQAKARHEGEEQPHPYEVGMDLATKMFDKWIAMMNPQGNAAAQQQLAAAQAQNATLQALQPLQQQMASLQADIARRAALEDQARQYGQLIGQRDKRLDELQRERDKLADQRLRSFEDTQIQMQQKVNDLLMDSGKGFTEEFRQTRRDVKDLLKEQMKQEQVVEQTRTRARGYTPVQELSVQEMEKVVQQYADPSELEGGKQLLDPELLAGPVETKRRRGDAG